MKLVIRTTYIFLLVCCGSWSHGQTCLDNIYNANKLLEEGDADACISLIMPCSYDTTNESFRWQTFKLMALAYWLKGNTDSSLLYTEKMLVINPTYHPNTLKDLQEFINQLNAVTIIPRFTMGLTIAPGSNIIFSQSRKSYVLSDYSKTYSNLNSFQFGANVGYYFNANLKLEAALLATEKKYNINYSFSDWEIQVAERLTYIDFPITAHYFFGNRDKTKFSLQSGLFGGYLLYDANDFISTLEKENKHYQLINANALERRNRFNYGVTAGLGVNFKVKTGNVSLLANYFHSIPKINKEEKRYDYAQQIYTYYYIDDDIVLQNLALSIGYQYNLNYKVYRTIK